MLSNTIFENARRPSEADSQDLFSGTERARPDFENLPENEFERDLSVLLDLIAIEATHLLTADRASIFLLDAEKGELWSKVALGSEDILRFDSRLGIAGAVTQAGETINVTDATKDTRFYPGIDRQTGYQTKSVLALPLRNLPGRFSERLKY
jgi:GAF domain-containing protein